MRVQPSEVGVICAFRRQVLKLRALLRKRGLGGVAVGQVCGPRARRGCVLSDPRPTHFVAPPP